MDVLRFVSSDTARWMSRTCEPFSSASISRSRSRPPVRSACNSACMTSVGESSRETAPLRDPGLTGQALTEHIAHKLCAADAPPLVGRFIVEAIIGEGGSGRVLRARHALLGFPLALKMLAHTHAESDTA